MALIDPHRTELICLTSVLLDHLPIYFSQFICFYAGNSKDIDKTIVVIASTTSFCLLCVAIFFFYRLYTHTSIGKENSNGKVFHEIELGWIDNENEIGRQSVWSNVYVTKLQDYETSEDENDDDGIYSVILRNNSCEQHNSMI